MKNFEYAAPTTEAEVLELLADRDGATEILAGGTDLVGLMKKMIVTPERVVNIMDVESIKGIEPTEDGGLAIGAAVTLDEVFDHPYMKNYPGIQQAISGINSMQLQCQGTLGGELCQHPRCWFFRDGRGLLDGNLVAKGDNRFHAILGNQGAAKFVSSSRIAPVLIALDAHLRIIGPGAEQQQLVRAADFFRIPRHAGQRETILEPQQLLTHIILPPAAGKLSSTYEVRDSAGPDYPLAAAAAVIEHSGGLVRNARLVLGQVAPVPWEAKTAAQLLVGSVITPEVADRAGQLAVAGATPLSQNAYKVQLAKTAAKRAILLAAGMETGGF